MGCDIHTTVEVKTPTGWKQHRFHPFDCRSYGLFGFLADVRNYSHVPTIKPREVPADISESLQEEIGEWGHSPTCITLKEFQDFDYDQKFWDRRITREESPNCFNGAALANEGEGRVLSIREFLGERFLKDIEQLANIAAKEKVSPEDVRVIMFFDN
jgi:hypothetical protein